MKIKLNITEIMDEEEEYFADMIHDVLDKMIQNEQTDNKIDTVWLVFQDGSEVEIR